MPATSADKSESIRLGVASWSCSIIIPDSCSVSGSGVTFTWLSSAPAKLFSVGQSLEEMILSILAWINSFEDNVRCANTCR